MSAERSRSRSRSPSQNRSGSGNRRRSPSKSASAERAKVRYTGVVKTWKEDRNFGFISRGTIAPDDLITWQGDVFVHEKELDGCEALREGDQVTFYVEKDQNKKAKATKVRGGTGKKAPKKEPRKEPQEERRPAPRVERRRDRSPEAPRRSNFFPRHEFKMGEEVEYRSRGNQPGIEAGEWVNRTIVGLRMDGRYLVARIPDGLVFPANWPTDDWQLPDSIRRRR